jgi:hypothetical protein
VSALASAGQDASWHRENFASLLQGEVGCNQRATFFWGFNDQYAERQTRDNAVAGGKVIAFRLHSKRIF